MSEHRPRKMPLLRGTLTALGDWVQDDADPNREVRSAVISVWCPFCRCQHAHGWNPAHNARVLQHRAAHCGSPESPFAPAGYVISPWRKSDPGYSGHAVLPGREIWRPRLIELADAPECAIPADDAIFGAMLAYAREAAISGAAWWPASLRDDLSLMVSAEHIADLYDLDRLAVWRELHRRMVAQFNAETQAG